MLFRDRTDAGRRLAARMTEYAGRTDTLVLALPRGGVPVAFEVARSLGAPLDVFLVRKLGVPGYEELAMGAIASGGVRVVNEDVVRHLGITPEVIDAVAAREQGELERRERAYRDERPAPDVRGRTVILVDDGLATGSTMRAAALALRQKGPARFVLLGEASHGTHEFYRERAEITKRLIEEKGFNAVAVEADWPDAYRVNRYVRGEGADTNAEEALGGFKRFPTWMWRNRVVVEFAEWLRRYNESRAAGRERVGFYGL